MATSPTVLRFGSTTCVIGPRWAVSTLPSGVEVHAHPDGSEAQGRTAERLGYGSDLDAMTRDHDPLHAWLAHAVGLTTSFALRSASGERVDGAIAGLEEDAVLAVQRFCRALGRMPWEAGRDV